MPMVSTVLLKSIFSSCLPSSAFVEGADAVGGDDDELVVEVVDVSDFSASRFVAGNVSFHYRFHDLFFFLSRTFFVT